MHGQSERNCFLTGEKGVKQERERHDTHEKFIN